MLGDGSSGVVYGLNTPDPAVLCSVTVKVPPLHSSTDTPYQAQVIRCRELIFTEPEILASPVYGMDGLIQIVLQQSLFKTGRLQARLQKIGIEMQKPRKVTTEVMQSCLNYTILAKAAPLWNKFGEILVEGREFLTSKEKMQAITLDLKVTESETYIALKGHLVKSQPIEIKDLGISPVVCHEFLSGELPGVQEYSIQYKWCHILPSMKKGQVVSISRNLPVDSPFKSYKDMKRYWKNTYGYRLPDTEDDLLFYQVYFKLIGDRLFTYPACCIRPREVLYLPRPDVQTILHTFFRDLTTRFPSLCGCKMQIQPQAGYPRCGLSSAVAVEQDPRGCSLSQKPTQTQVRPGPARPPTFSQTIVQGSVVPVPGSMRLSQAGTGVDRNQTLSSQAASNQAASNHAISNRQMLNHPVSQRPMSNQAAFQQSGSQQMMSEQPASQLGVPPSQTGTSQSVPSHNQATLAASQTKLVPMFKPMKRPAAPGQALPISQKPAKIVPSFQRQNLGTGKVTPAVLPASTVAKVKSGHSATTGQMFRMSGCDLVNSRGHNVVAGHSMSRPSSQHIPVSTAGQHTLGAGWNGGEGRVVRPGEQPAPRAAHPHSFMPSSVATLPTPGRLSLTHQKPQRCDSPGQKPVRSKPRVQEGLDIETLARKGMLSGVNSATLNQWLKDRGIACKSKDKKADLVDRVTTYMHMKHPEH